jgi:phage-related protein
MAVLKGFTFDGIKSVDYGVIVIGSNLYGAPERVVDMIEVPGRNGALALDQGRYSNVQVVYHCVMYDRDQADFAQRIAGLRNELCSRHSYVRLENDWDADEYRLGMYREGLDADIVLERGGEFDLVFECKPQRFLTSGEEMITVGDWGDVTEYSGDIVSFEGDEMTAVKSLTVPLSPVQDLNGYDHPWVGGAGKNLFDEQYPNIDGSMRRVYVQTGNGTFTLSTTAQALTGTANLFLQAGQVTSGESSGGNGVYSGHPRTVTTTDGYVTISYRLVDNSTDVNNPQKSKTQLELGTTATAYEPYSNICPISGWDGVSVPIAGDNLLPMPITSGTYANGVTVTVNPDLSFTITKPTNSGWTSFALGTFTLKAGTYTLIEDDDASGNAGMELFNDDAGASITVTRYVKRRVITLTETTRVHATFARSAAATDVLTKLMLFIGDTATAEAYEPYQGNTYIQEFKDSQGNTLTVYGGDSEIVGGVLTVSKYFAEFDGSSDENWRCEALSGSGIGNFYIAMPSTVKNTQNKTTGLICSHVDASPRNASVINTCFISNARNFNITIADTIGVSTAADFKTWLQSNHVQVVCELATPQTYTLTPQQVETLIGTNNIWSDAGEVTFEIADDPNKIVNPTLYDAKPLIKVSGYGTVQVGSVTITIEGSASDVTYIDCDSMECYRLNGLASVSANSAVSFSSYDFPVLEADAITGITYSTNISQVQIVPRWWQL